MAEPSKSRFPIGALESPAKAGRARAGSVLTRRFAKPLVFCLCLIPLACLVYWWLTDQLGFNPVETLMRFTGTWTLRFLLITLCISPLRRLPGWSSLIRFRRMLGLFAFFYGCIHLLNYLNFDKAWNWAIVWEDLTFRRFYIFGLAAFSLMLPLALTSSTAAIRALGKNWQRLHRLIYLSASAGIVHFYLQDKIPDPQSINYGIILGTLLAARVLLFGYRKFTLRTRTP